MEENGRRIRSIAKKDWWHELTRDPIRLLEVGLVGFGAAVAALSAYFSWQAAATSSEQARYAREALSSSEANATFKTYIASWNKLCTAVAPRDYKLFVGTPYLFENGDLVVTVSNSGFDRALFDIDAHNERVSNQEDIVRDNLLELRSFLPGDIFGRPDQALTVTAYFYIMNIPTEGDDELKTRLVRAAALCNYYTEEQLRWYKDKSRRIAPIVYLLTRMKIEYSEDSPPTPGRR